MPDPLCSQCKRRFHRLRTVGFPGMRCKSQSRVPREPVSLAELRRRTADLITANPERDRAVVHVFRRQARHLHDVVRPELADRIKIPPDFYACASMCVPLRVTDSAPHRGEIESAPQHHPCRHRDLRISHTLARQRFHQAGGNQSVIFRPAQPLHYKFEAGEEAGKIAESPYPVRFLGGNGRIE